jgi:hypothetical protein
MLKINLVSTLFSVPVDRVRVEQRGNSQAPHPVNLTNFCKLMMRFLHASCQAFEFNIIDTITATRRLAY